MERHIPGPGLFAIEVSGESRRQKALEEICGGKRYDSACHEVRARLVLEDDNPVDPNAVRVDVNGAMVGYLDAELAPIYRRALSRAGYHEQAATCDAQIRGGWDRGPEDRGMFGIFLDIWNGEGEVNHWDGTRRVSPYQPDAES